MSYKHSFSLYMTLIALCFFTGCNSTNDSARVVQTQEPIADDLEATLEEAVLTLSTHVSDVISSINNMGTPKGSVSDKQNQYQEWKIKLEHLEERIDGLEDTLDQNIRSRYISHETYDKLDRELSSLEQLIDSAEDKLDRLFHVVD